ncbi:hypothetical protein [Manganibacter manganicus]|uniref:DUF2155 domain-containing protein n=1 Tax=Manganibacter manganicus TaxID=1873176 RepID=A0A1V8RVE0_9HYPH|nr:hypothetical protein [Pseudaminobacter manganicus]OQM77171.1 hypothetical protein BFN67_10325 [Pseudaminobacter manganicus]
MRPAAVRLALAVCAVVPAAPAFAAGPIELAVYDDRDGVAEIDFTPVDQSATITNRFRMIFADAVILDGRVEWSDNAARPYGTLTRNCPSGDVTDDELAACTLWSGVVYTADEMGAVGLLPRQGESAPRNLIFSGLGPALANGRGDAAPAKTPWDVFFLKGCQE